MKWEDAANFKSFISNMADVMVVLLLAGATMLSGKVKEAIKKRSQKRFEKGIENNVKIKELMIELRGLSDADRVKLFQFHNGEYYTSGESIMKASLTHIVLNTGVSMPGATPSAHQSIPTTHLLYLLNNLQTNGLFETYADLENVKDPFFQYMFMSSGTRKAVFVPIRDVRKHWIGFLAITYRYEKEQIDTQEVRDYAEKIGILLSKGI